MDSAHYRMTNIGMMNKVPYLVPDHAHPIIMESNSALCMANNGKGKKHTRHISRIINFIINCEDLYMYKTVWCEGCLEISDIGNKGVRENEFIPILGYTMVRLYNLQNTCTRRVI